MTTTLYGLTQDDLEMLIRGRDAAQDFSNRAIECLAKYINEHISNEGVRIIDYMLAHSLEEWSSKEEALKAYGCKDLRALKRRAFCFSFKGLKHFVTIDLSSIGA